MSRLRMLALPVLLISMGSFALTGCTTGGHFSVLGYSTQPNFDTSIATVYVPIAQNATYYRGIEFDLTRLVIREIESRTPYRVVSCQADADTVLDLKILFASKTMILAAPTNLVRDSEVAMNVELVWRDQRPGRRGDVLSQELPPDLGLAPLPGQEPVAHPKVVPLKVTPSATFIPELGGSLTTALYQANQRAAVQIVSMMETYRPCNPNGR